MNRKSLLTMLALISAIASACAAPPTKPASTQTPLPIVAPETTLQGVYVMTISKEELLANKTLLEQDACENAGVFTYTLMPGRWHLSQTAAPGCAPVLGVEFDGDWKLSGNQMISHWKSAPGCDLDSTYTWKLEGATLTLTAVKDTCPARVALFATHPWVRQK